MVIASNEIKIRLSTKSGAAGNSLASTPIESLGKYMSTTELVDDVLHNLFDVLSGNENLALDEEYRCFFVFNTSPTDTLLNTLLYIISEVAQGADVAFAVDSIAASVAESASAQALEIADEDSAPAGLTFTIPTDLGTALDLGDLPPNHCKAVWVRRTATNSPAQELDGVSFRIQGETL